MVEVENWVVYDAQISGGWCAGNVVAKDSRVGNHCDGPYCWWVGICSSFCASSFGLREQSFG